MRLIILPLTAILAGSAIAACGGSNKPPATTAQHGSSFKSFVAEVDKQAACMRAHGITNFPDPKIIDHNGEQGVQVHLVHTGAPGGGPKFQAAAHACARFAPAGSGGNVNQGESAAQVRTHTDALLAFARCMRTHGFPTFPDPDSQGQLSLTMVTNAGIQIHQPAVLKAGLTCAGTTHGVLTRADVIRAVNGGAGTPTSSAAAVSNGGG
jgi:hypothetical protein